MALNLSNYNPEEQEPPKNPANIFVMHIAKRFCLLCILPLKFDASSTLASPLFVSKWSDGDLNNNTDFQTIQTYEYALELGKKIICLRS